MIGTFHDKSLQTGTATLMSSGGALEAFPGSRDPSPHRGAESAHQPEQLPPEPLTDKHVQHGVEAAVAVRDHLGHLPRPADVVAALARLVQAHHLQGPEEACDVIGQPAAEEHGHHRRDQPHGRRLGRRSGQQRVHDAAVAERHDDQRDHQAQDVHLEEAEDRPPVPAAVSGGVVLVIVQRGAEHRAVVRLRLQEARLGERRQDAGGPRHCGRQHAEGPRAGPERENGVHDGQVPVDAHEHEEEDAGVEAHVVGGQHRLACAFSEAPLVARLVGEEGQRAEQEQVGHRQVEQADVGHAAEARARRHHPHHQHVAREAHEEEEGVDGR
ncbi:hypothetical protein CRUP_006445 [Coryphaenoides rupestris]|nr:hypothetical protein CRUP_006445 [Coryphaenoides rupestris]